MWWYYDLLILLHFRGRLSDWNATDWNNARPLAKWVAHLVVRIDYELLNNTTEASAAATLITTGRFVNLLEKQRFRLLVTRSITCGLPAWAHHVAVNCVRLSTRSTAAFIATPAMHVGHGFIDNTRRRRSGCRSSHCSVQMLACN